MILSNHYYKILTQNSLLPDQLLKVTPVASKVSWAVKGNKRVFHFKGVLEKAFITLYISQ